MLQQLIQNRWNFKVVILFVALYGAAAFAMNIPVVEEDSQSEKTIRIFNPEEALRNGRPWSKVVPRNILITPDGKGALMAECQGRVRYVSFDPHHSEVIIDHCRDVEFYPIIATAQKEDGSLLVVSAGNYNINMQGSAE